MPRKSLIIIAVVAVAGMAAILWFVRRSERADHFAPAMEHLSSVGSFAAAVSLDTMFTLSSEAGGDGGSTPLRVSGTVRAGHSSGGELVKAEADLSVDAGNPAARLMTASAILADDGIVYSMVDDLPAELADVIDVDALNGTWFSLGTDALSLILPWAVSEGVQGVEGAPFDAAQGGEGAPFDAAQGGEGAEGQIFLPGRRFDDTIMEGVPVAHYEVLIDKSGLIAALMELNRSLLGRPCTDEETAAIADYASGTGFFAEAFIDKRNDRFYLIKAVAVPSRADDGSSPVALTVKFTGFGAPVSVKAPDGARPLSSVLFKLLRVSGSSAVDDR